MFSLAKGYTYLLLAILIWSTQAFVTKLLVGSLGFVMVYLFSSLIAGATLLFLYFLNSKNTGFRKLVKKPKEIIFISILLSVSNFLLFASFSVLNASSVVIVLYTYPVFMGVLNPLLFGNKIRAKEIFGLFLGFFGILIFATNGTLTSLHLTNPYAYLMTLGGAVAWALYLIVQKHFKLEVVSSNGVAFLLSALYILPILPFIGTGGFSSGGLTAPQILSMLLYFGIATFGIANILYLVGLKTVKVTSAAILSYMTPVIAVILNYLVLGEMIYWYDLAPLLCVFLGYLVMNLGSYRTSAS